MSPQWNKPEEEPKKNEKPYGPSDFNETSSGGGFSPEKKIRRKKKKN